MAVADRVPDYAEVRPVDKDQSTACTKESAMIAEASLLPVALRDEELTERQFDAIYRNAIDPNATKGRLRRKPRSIPTVEREAVAS